MSLLLVAGCVSAPYPAAWVPPARDTAASCTSVAGSFENFGVWDNGDRVVMATLFFPLEAGEPLVQNYERLAVTRLSITFPQESILELQGWVENDLLFERRLTRAGFECREQQLVLHDSSGGIDGIAPFLPLLYRSSVERRLSRAEDGALIVENHELSGGVLAIIPVALKARYWFRFEASPATRTPVESARLPGGLRQGDPELLLLQPPDGAPRWSGYQQAADCLSSVRQTGDEPRPTRPSALGGRSTQAFLLQGEDDDLLPYGISRGNDWIPATHGLRIEKQHRQPPELADRYVECLLDKGYRWDAEPADSAFSGNL